MINQEELLIPFTDYSLVARRLFPDITALPQAPIVFLHDSFGCIEAWKEFPVELVEATGRGGVVYDRRGYGKSSPAHLTPRRPDYLHREAQILIEILDWLHIEQAVLFGHSDGGTIALLAAASFPDRITAVIAEGAHVFVEEIGLEGIRKAIIQYRGGDLRSRLERYHGGQTEWVFRSWSDTWLSPDFRDWNIENYLTDIRCPVLTIQGENDEYGTMAQVEAIERGVSGQFERLIVPGVGHTPHKDARETVVKAVMQFLTS